MLTDRKRLFHIISAEGEDYYVTADSFSEAHKKFREWENPLGDDEMEDVQSIIDAGYPVDPEYNKLPSGIFERKAS